MQTLKYFSITVIFSTLCAFSGFKYAESKLQQDLTDEVYYQNALELKQHVAFLKALEEKRYDASALWHKNFMDSNLIALDTYGKDSSEKYQRQVTNIIAEAKIFKDLKEKEATASTTAVPTKPASSSGIVATPTPSQLRDQSLVKIVGSAS